MKYARFPFGIMVDLKPPEVSQGGEREHNRRSFLVATCRKKEEKNSRKLKNKNKAATHRGHVTAEQVTPTSPIEFIVTILNTYIIVLSKKRRYLGYSVQ